MTMTDNLATEPLTELPPEQLGLDETMPFEDDHAGAIPQMDFSRPIKIADHICSNTKQLVLMVCDKSGSMVGDKIAELNLARLALVHELVAPENKDGFFLGVIDFDKDAAVALESQSVHGLQLPDAKAGGGTRFDAALNEASKMVTAFQNQPNQEGWHFLRPQVLFLSDGHSPVSQACIEDLQENANIWSIAYGSGADQRTLSAIASDGQVHTVGIQGGELRKFLATVGKTLTETMGRRTKGGYSYRRKRFTHSQTNTTFANFELPAEALVVWGKILSAFQNPAAFVEKYLRLNTSNDQVHEIEASLTALRERQAQITVLVQHGRQSVCESKPRLCLQRFQL